MAMLNWENRISKYSVNVGAEIEFFGMYRKTAIQLVCESLGSVNFHHGSHLDEYYTYDENGKKWSIVSDSSIKDENGEKQYEKGCELVTPVMNNSDFAKLEKIVKNLADNGAKVSQYCGLHVHASNDLIGAPELIKLVQHMYTRQDLLFRFCKVYTDRISEWAEPITEDFARAVKKCDSVESIKRLWYKTYSHGFDSSHYNASRYHNLNLHSYFEGKGVEFRLFNSTLDFDKISVILDLVQGFVMDSINSYKMSQYLHTDRTVYSNPDRMYTLLNTYCDRMGLNPNTKKFLLSENL